MCPSNSTGSSLASGRFSKLIQNMEAPLTIFDNNHPGSPLICYQVPFTNMALLKASNPGNRNNKWFETQGTNVDDICPHVDDIHLRLDERVIRMPHNYGPSPGFQN